MKRSLWALVAVALAVGAGLVPATAGAQQDQGTPDSDIGVTADTIRIAVIADVDNPVQPGLFQGTVKGVQAFGKYMNGHGKLAGRNVQVDFIDSHLSADEARNAVIRACQEDFAIVGTNALFLNNVQPMEQCVDKAGQATGLPDVPTLQAETAHQCSPISFAVIAAAIDCSTVNQHPQTYSARVGQIVQYYKKQNKGLNGVWVLPSDLKSTINSTTPVATGDVKAGVKKDEDFFKISGLATQSDYTPVAQSIKQHNSTYAQSISDYKSSLKMRKEAKVQGVTGVKVWDCALQCYDAKFLSEGGADVEGQYASLFFIPFEEAKQNKSVDAFLKSIGGKSQADGFAAQAWTSGLFFRDVVNNVVKANGNNGLTRARFLEEARKIHDFRAEVGGQGMLGPTDVGGKKLNGCFVLTQVKNGKYVRIFPKQKGTLNCDSKNVTTIQLDQT